MYSEMSVADFETYLTMLGNDVLIAGEQYDIIVIGGYAIIKYYSSKYRTMTRDIDFGYMDYYEDEDNTSLMQYANSIRDTYHLDPHWFNCDSGPHISEQILQTTTHVDTYGGINIYVPSAEALLAMKTVSARTENEGNDYLDIPLLLEITGMSPDIQTLEANAQLYMPEEFSYRYNYVTRGKLEHILTNAGYVL